MTRTTMVYYRQSQPSEPFFESQEWLTAEGDLVARESHGDGDENWWINEKKVESFNPTELGEYDIDVPLTPGTHFSPLYPLKQS